MEFSFSNADYLHERLDRPDPALYLDGADADFFAWKDVLAASGEAVFSKRLTSLSLNEAQARQRTRRAQENTEPAAPRWFTILEEAFNSRDAQSISESQPFADIWAPIAANARTKIEFSDLLSPSVNGNSSSSSMPRSAKSPPNRLYNFLRLSRPGDFVCRFRRSPATTR